MVIIQKYTELYGIAVGTSSVAPTTGIRVTTEVVFGDGKLRNTNERVA